MIAAHSYGSLGSLWRGLGGRSRATPRLPGFDPRPVYVLLVVDRVTLREVTHLLHASTHTRALARTHFYIFKKTTTNNYNVLLTVPLSTTLVNDQLDAQLLYPTISPLQPSTYFEQRRAHHQEVKLY